MKTTGFSFIRNALIYDYPIVEAITSILPLCDQFVIAVGKSDDDTYQLIDSIDRKKIRIIDTIWDEDLREGGRVLAQQTDKAFAEVSEDTDWAFYIQGDEVIHEKYLDVIDENMRRYKDDLIVDGLLFQYLHFYGSYDYVGTSSKWYRNEIRIIRNDKSIYSYRDAQGFRKKDNEKLKVKPVNACVYHYGWVKEPRAMQKKQENFHKYWHDDKWIDKNIFKAEEFDYIRNLSSLKLFEGTHPKVMQKRIEAKNWKFDYDISFNKTGCKDKIKTLLRNYLGLDFSYSNYQIV
ncbi:MAG TPA: hypothetical protein VJ346_03900 [Bacteroidales bacterium]|nr:hypothetical protein [Bacteroidales bacterium]